MDFIFNSGSYKGNTVDFMLTPDTFAQATKINQYFEQNLNGFMGTLVDHANAADFVPLDTRFLSPANQGLLTDAINNLPQQLQSKIILFR